MTERLQSVRKFFQTRPALIICAVGGVLMAVAYLTIFVTTGPDSIGFSRNMSSALSNAVPLSIYAYLAISLLRTHVIGRAGWQQVALNAVAMPAFGFTWYVTVIVLLGWSQGSLNEGFSVSPFRGPAFAWQFFQGMTAYAAVAGAAYALEYRSRIEPEQQAAEDVSASASASTLILRQGDELRPVEISEIILITGAGDYTEVATARGTHLSRKSLSEFEALLPSDVFVRVHRSRIVNLEAVNQAEPAGSGRLTLQLNEGLSVSTSRAGARLIRDRSI